MEKESASKFVKNLVASLQRRFVTVSEDGTLRYYKNESAAHDTGNALNVIDVSAALFVRAYDTSKDCIRFEIGESDATLSGSSNQSRTFLFQAESVEERIRWVSVLSALAAHHNNTSESTLSEQAAIVKCYDEGGRDALLEKVNESLEEIYPSLWATGAANLEEEGKNDSPHSMSAHLVRIQGTISYLETRLKEVKKTKTRAPRYDVMVLIVDAVNRFIDVRLHLLMLEDGPTMAYEKSTTAETYS